MGLCSLVRLPGDREPGAVHDQSLTAAGVATTGADRRGRTGLTAGHILRVHVWTHGATPAVHQNDRRRDEQGHIDAGSRQLVQHLHVRARQSSHHPRWRRFEFGMLAWTLKCSCCSTSALGTVLGSVHCTYTTRRSSMAGAMIAPLSAMARASLACRCTRSRGRFWR